MKSWFKKLSVEYLYIFVFKEATVYDRLKHIDKELGLILENDLMKKKIFKFDTFWNKLRNYLITLQY